MEIYESWIKRKHITRNANLQLLPQEQRKYRSSEQVTKVTALNISNETFLLVCNTNQQNALFINDLIQFRTCFDQTHPDIDQTPSTDA